jgi:hypothetical protein
LLPLQVQKLLLLLHNLLLLLLLLDLLQLQAGAIVPCSRKRAAERSMWGGGASAEGCTVR